MTPNEIDDLIFGCAPSCKIEEGRALVEIVTERVQAETRRAIRREALMKMQKLWQESNPDGLIYNGVAMDGVEYQKAIRAEWERK